MGKTTVKIVDPLITNGDFVDRKGRLIEIHLVKEYDGKSYNVVADADHGGLPSLRPLDHLAPSVPLVKLREDNWEAIYKALDHFFNPARDKKLDFQMFSDGGEPVGTESYMMEVYPGTTNSYDPKRCAELKPWEPQKIEKPSLDDFRKMMEELDRKTLEKTGVDHSQDTPIDGVAMKGGGWFFRCGNMFFINGDAGRENIIKAFESEVKKFTNKLNRPEVG